MRIRAIFHGRKINAIGISGFQCVDLDVPDPDSGLPRDLDWHALNLKLYDTHEHISRVRWINRDTGKEISE